MFPTEMETEIALIPTPARRSLAHKAKPCTQGKAIQYYGSDDPSGQTSQLLTLIWDGLCEPILTCRNDIRTNTPNPKDLLETQNLRQKLEWYKKYKEEVLPHRL
jgi:hypothetical protein